MLLLFQHPRVSSVSWEYGIHLKPKNVWLRDVGHLHTVNVRQCQTFVCSNCPADCTHVSLPETLILRTSDLVAHDLYELESVRLVSAIEYLQQYMTKRNTYNDTNTQAIISYKLHVFSLSYVDVLHASWHNQTDGDNTMWITSYMCFRCHLGMCPMRVCTIKHHVTWRSAGSMCFRCHAHVLPMHGHIKHIIIT